MLTAALRHRIKSVRRDVPVSGNCWEWTGCLSTGGYGRVSRNGFVYYTHRLVFEDMNGPIPEGLQLDHLCRNRKCCNPSHLEPVTQAINIQRGNGPMKVRCDQGHELTGWNLIVKSEHSRGRRECRACMYARQREYYQRKTAGAK